MTTATLVDYSQTSDDKPPPAVRTYPHLPAAIHGERSLRRMSQARLGVLVGVRREQVSRWEGGDRPGRAQVDTLSDLFSMTIYGDGSVTADGEIDDIPTTGAPVVIVVVGTIGDAEDVLRRIGVLPERPTEE